MLSEELDAEKDRSVSRMQWMDKGFVKMKREMQEGMTVEMILTIDLVLV